jgi:glycosyltransferase involved in cell wall biosynthesis
MTPAFSVIIPVFNAADHVGATIESVLAQTWRDFEVIVIDDGSTDNSFARCNHYACHDPRIRLVSQSNCGVAATRNFGAELARGRLLAFLDADDLWAADKLAAHLALHDAVPVLHASYAQIAFIRDDTALHDARTLSTVLHGTLSVLDALGENPVCTASNLVVDRAAFLASKGFRTGMQYAEDQEWLVRFALDHVIVGLDALLVGYRMSANGLSADLAAMLEGWRSFAADYTSPRELRAMEALYCRYLARRSLRIGDAQSRALQFVKRGIERDAHSFFNNPRRGALTAAAALVQPLFPRWTHEALFA